MPSMSARIIGFVLRTGGVYRRMYSGGPSFPSRIAKVRAARVAEPSAKARAKLDVSSSEFEGRTVWRLAPKATKPSATMLYWHGGGYVYPPTPGHWSFLAGMAETYGWEVIAPCYPLAPEAEAQEVTDFALAFYRDLLGRTDKASLIMGGDSAGGGLAVATTQLARDAGLTLPKGLVLVCPWLNVVPDNPDQAKIEPRDAILTISGIRAAGALYGAKLGTNDPRVSPIHGSLAGVPPILAFGGGDDILVVDARALKAALPATDYTEVAGMIHDWPIFTFPESKAAQARMAGFVGEAVLAVQRIDGQLG
jgi:epsilon-lactone hydrolase